MGTGYKELDKAIKSHIGSKPGDHPMYSPPLLDMAAKELGRAKCFGDDKEWRLIDRRLQALKKAGEVEFVRRPSRWVLVSYTNATDSNGAADAERDKVAGDKAAG
jgi:hypothetical protein